LRVASEKRLPSGSKKRALFILSNEPFVEHSVKRAQIGVEKNAQMGK
jgi:hypothetical protein